jgi:hypothetical protein
LYAKEIFPSAGDFMNENLMNASQVFPSSLQLPSLSQQQCSSHFMSLRSFKEEGC